MAAKRVSGALAVSLVALAIIVGFGGVMLACGYHSTSAESVTPGEAPALQTSRCVAFVHPVMPAMLVSGGLVVASVVRGGRSTAIWIGGTLALVTLPWFSLGLVGTVVGLVMVGAGLLVARAREEPSPRASLSLALVGLAMAIGLWIGPLGPEQGWGRPHGSPPWILMGATVATLALALPAPQRWMRAPFLATLVGAFAFWWEGSRFLADPGSFADPFAAAFLLASGLAALQERRRALRRRMDEG